MGSIAIKRHLSRNFPLVNAGDNEQKQYQFFQIIFLFLTTTKKEISNHVPNSHIAQLFEEVIDAMVNWSSTF